MVDIPCDASGQLDVRAFADWLVAHSHDEPVGMAQSSEACPLASYLAEITDVQCSVWPVGYRFSGEQLVCWRGWASWTSRFVKEIDRRFGGSISASEAFAVLLELVPELRDEWRGQ
jgi:hypothetical protein